MMDAFGGLIGSGLLNDQEFISEIMRMNGITDVARLMGPGAPDPVPEELPPEEMPPGVPGGPPPQGMPPQGLQGQSPPGAGPMMM